MAEQSAEVAAAMHDMQYQDHVMRVNTVDDKVIADGKAAQSRAQILATRAA